MNAKTSAEKSKSEIKNKILAAALNSCTHRWDIDCINVEQFNEMGVIATKHEKKSQCTWSHCVAVWFD